MQRHFSNGLLDPSVPPPSGVIGPNGRAAGARYDVYRNNVTASLIEALAAAYPVVKTIVGKEFFDAMAALFTRKHPPKSPLMIYYGEEFPEFLTRFPPAAHLGYLPDVARVERARRWAYHGPDASPCAPSALSKLEGDNLYNARLVLHPTLKIVRSRYPVFSIWRFNSTKDKSPIGKAKEITMISRPADQVIMQNPSNSVTTFIESLSSAPLGVAIDKAKGAEGDFDLTDALTGLLSSGLLIDIK